MPTVSVKVLYDTDANIVPTTTAATSYAGIAAGTHHMLTRRNKIYTTLATGAAGPMMKIKHLPIGTIIVIP